MRIGADPEALGELARAMGEQSHRLRDAASRIDRRLASARWDGPDARAFLGGWARDRALLLRHADTLAAAGRSLDRQAAQQRDASAGGAHVPSPGGPSPRLRRVLDQLGPLPEEVSTGWLAVGLSAGASVGAGGRLVVADLPGPTSLVTTVQRAEVGASVGAGSASSVRWSSGGGRGDPKGPRSAVVALGAEAGVTAHATAKATRSWEVPDGDAGRTAAVAATREAADGLGGATAGLVASALDVAGLGSVVERVGRAVGVHDPLGRSPDVRTDVVGVSVGATAVAGQGATARAHVQQSFDVGTRQREGGRSLVLAAAGEASAHLPTQVLGLSGMVGAPAGAASVEVEVMPGHDGARPVVVTTQADRSSGPSVTRTVIVLDDDAAGDAIERTFDELRAGDVLTASRHAAGIAGAVEEVHVEVVEGTSRGTDAGATIAAAEVIEGSVTAEGGWTTTEFHQPRRPRDRPG